MSVIEASFVRVAGTLADGTLRVVVDIEPRNAQAAFALFNSPGTPMALAALKPGAVPVEQEQEQERKDHSWSRQAGIWCQDEEFQAWVAHRCQCSESSVGEQQAKEFVLMKCAIDSRKELDTSQGARDAWLRDIAGPYRKWRIARGLE